MGTEALNVGTDGRLPLLIERRLAQAVRMIEFGRVTFTIYQRQIVGVYIEERRNLLPKGQDHEKRCEDEPRLRKHLGDSP